LVVASDEILVFANFSLINACRSIFFLPAPKVPLFPYNYFETLEWTSDRSWSKAVERLTIEDFYPEIPPSISEGVVV